MAIITNPNTNYYVISLNHTRKKDKFFTLWRPNNAGYTWFKEWAGFYRGYQEGYHNMKDHSMAIAEKEANELFIYEKYENRDVFVILNTPENRKILGITIKQLL